MDCPSIQKCLERLVNVRMKSYYREQRLSQTKSDSEKDLDDAEAALLEAQLELARFLETKQTREEERQRRERAMGIISQLPKLSITEKKE